MPGTGYKTVPGADRSYNFSSNFTDTLQIDRDKNEKTYFHLNNSAAKSSSI